MTLDDWVALAMLWWRGRGRRAIASWLADPHGAARLGREPDAALPAVAAGIASRLASPGGWRKRVAGRTPRWRRRGPSASPPFPGPTAAIPRCWRRFRTRRRYCGSGAMRTPGRARRRGRRFAGRHRLRARGGPRPRRGPGVARGDRRQRAGARGRFRRAPRRAGRRRPDDRGVGVGRRHRVSPRARRSRGGDRPARPARERAAAGDDAAAQVLSVAQPPHQRPVAGGRRGGGLRAQRLADYRPARPRAGARGDGGARERVERAESRGPCPAQGRGSDRGDRRRRRRGARPRSARRRRGGRGRRPAVGDAGRDTAPHGRGRGLQRRRPRRRSGLDSASLLARLTDLELQGRVARAGAGQFVRAGG